MKTLYRLWVSQKQLFYVRHNDFMTLHEYRTDFVLHLECVYHTVFSRSWVKPRSSWKVPYSSAKTRQLYRYVTSLSICLSVYAIQQCKDEAAIQVGHFTVCLSVPYSSVKTRQLYRYVTSLSICLSVYAIQQCKDEAAIQVCHFTVCLCHTAVQRWGSYTGTCTRSLSVCVCTIQSVKMRLLYR